MTGRVKKKKKERRKRQLVSTVGIKLTRERRFTKKPKIKNEIICQNEAAELSKLHYKCFILYQRLAAKEDTQ